MHSRVWVRLRRPARACLRQRLITAAVYPYLLREVMCGVANPNVPTAITAPAAWRHALASRGIRVQTGSGIRWMALLLLLWAHGIYVAIARAPGRLEEQLSTSTWQALCRVDEHDTEHDSPESVRF